jgi:hypothetical protein
MPKYFIYPIITIIFALILIANVPKKEIQRLSIYGIIFGGMMDVLVHFFGYITGLFAWINYGPFGFIGVHIFADVAWSIFFIFYLYYNMVVDLGILKSVSRIWLPLFGFAFWFSIATWGYCILNSFIEGKLRRSSELRDNS